MADAPLALLTGGSRGIGAAVREALAATGWEVLAPVRGELDLASKDSVDAYVRGLEDSGRPVTGLVLNAAVNRPGQIGTLSHDEWNSTMAVNVGAAFQLISYLCPRMAQSGMGRMVAISSAYAGRARFGRGAYSASKAALEALVRTVAVEYGAYGVVANCVAPGFVDTDLTRANNSQQSIDALLTRVPIGRLATPAEVADAVVFLMSPANTYITGQCLGVDGGFACT